LFQFLATCARLSCILSFRVHVKLCYRIRIVSYRIVLIREITFRLSQCMLQTDGQTTAHGNTVLCVISCGKK